MMSINRKKHLITQIGMTVLLSIGMIFSAASQQDAEAAPHSINKSRRSKTVKTTRRKTRKVSRRKSVSRRSSISRSSGSSNRVVASRSNRRSHYRSSRRGGRTVVHHRPYYAPTRTSSRSGVMNDVLLEVGGQVFSPIQGEVNSGLQLAVGSRLGQVAGVIEAQFADKEMGAELQDVNAQLRVYLPVSPFVEMYPLVAVGESNNGVAESSSHLDLGIGAQVKLGDHLAIGGRYSARVISETSEGSPTNGHNLLAHVSLTF